MGRKVEDLSELTTVPEGTDEFYILDKSESSGTRGKRVKFEKIVEGAIAEHTDGGPSKHDASEIDYERTNVDRKDIDNASDDVESALTDLDENKLSRSGSQAMTGNLNMGGNNVNNVGTVDGRDVSADGTKLDGIEANAKDDQSAAEVPFDGSSTQLTASDVQGALEQVMQSVVDPHVIVVSKNPGPAQFSSIKAAVDSITTATQANPFIVQVNPGIYVEDTITMKPYVTVAGLNDDTTIIEVDSSSKSVIVGASRSEIRNVTLRGSTDLGVAAVYHRGIDASVQPFAVINCAFGNNSTLIKLEGDSFPSLMRIEGCRVISGSAFTKALEVTRTGIGSTIMFVGTFIYQQLTPPLPQSLFEVSNGARLVIDTSLIEISGAAVDGFIISNGGILDVVYCAIDGANRGLYVPNTGSAPAVNCADLIIRNCVQDVTIDHPGTTGNFSGAADFSKVTIAAPDLSVVYKDVVNGGLAVSGAFRLGRTQDTLVDALDLIESSPPMGVINGGALSNQGGFDVGVAAGFGYWMSGAFPDHILERIDWPDQNITLLPNQDVYIYFNTSGILTSASSYPFTPSNILLGRVVTDGTGIEFIENIPMNAHHFGNHLDRFIREAFGSVYASGSIVTENASPRKLDVSAGVYYLSGNRITPTAGTAITLHELYRDGAGGYFSSSKDTVNNTQYDDGSGTLQSLTAGYFAKHDLFITYDGVTPNYYLVLSQAEYDSLASAQTATLAVPPAYLRAASVRIASLIIQEGQNNIQAVIDGRPTLGFKADAVSASSDHGNLTGLSDDDHLQYLLVSGSRAMSGSLNMGGNNINNAGIINGVTIQAHASRHLPNGADPLTTAAPTTALSGATTNSVGTANSLARSDHTHAIALATVSISGLMSASDKSKLDGIEANAKDDQVAAEVPYDNSGSTLSATNVKSALDELDTEKQNLSAKGQPNGYASLDGSGKIPESQLPTKMMEFEGNWDASTNTPTLADTDTGKQGTVYRVSAAGTVDFGAGSISFDIGDWVYNNGSQWQRGDNVDQVTSVFGRIGNVTAQDADYSASQIVYSNATSGLAATRVQGAIDEVEGRLDTAEALLNAHASRHLPDGADPITTAAAISLSASTSNGVGTANSLARSDHSHAILTGVVSTQIPDQANAAGTSANLARADHVHNIPTAVASSLSAGATNQQGSAGSFARSDHIHQVPTASAVELTDSTNAEGAATTFARSNHTHAHGNRGGGSLHALVTESVHGFMSATDKTKLNRMDHGYLQYTNNSLQTTTSASYVAVLLQASVDSFANGYLTKVNNTDFRTDFNGYIRVTYHVTPFTGDNDRGTEFIVRRNGADQSASKTRNVSKNIFERTNSVAAELIIPCAVNDIFTLNFRSIEGSVVNLTAGYVTMKVEVYRIS